MYAAIQCLPGNGGMVPQGGGEGLPYRNERVHVGVLVVPFSRDGNLHSPTRPGNFTS